MAAENVAESDVSKSIGRYAIDPERVGPVNIISNTLFKERSFNLPESDTDAAQLKRLFRKVGFKDINVHENKSRDDMLEIFKVRSWVHC